MTAEPARGQARADDPGAARTAAPLAALVERIEDDTRLDAAVAALDRIARPLHRRRGLRSALRGERIGHALHPLLTDVPLGTWMSATVLDLAGGRRARPAARLLLGVGVAAAVPTVVTGVAEWQAAGPRARRVGIAHGVVNSAGLVLYALSLVARLRGRHRRGVVLALSGAGVVSVGGYLGGHLSLVHKVGTADPRLLDRADPGGEGAAPGGD